MESQIYLIVGGVTFILVCAWVIGKLKPAIDTQRQSTENVLRETMNTIRQHREELKKELESERERTKHLSYQLSEAKANFRKAQQDVYAAGERIEFLDQIRSSQANSIENMRTDIQGYKNREDAHMKQIQELLFANKGLEHKVRNVYKHHLTADIKTVTVRRPYSDKMEDITVPADTDSNDKDACLAAEIKPDTRKCPSCKGKGILPRGLKKILSECKDCEGLGILYMCNTVVGLIAYKKSIAARYMHPKDDMSDGYELKRQADKAGQEVNRLCESYESLGKEMKDEVHSLDVQCPNPDCSVCYEQLNAGSPEPLQEEATQLAIRWWDNLDQRDRDIYKLKYGWSDNWNLPSKTNAILNYHTSETKNKIQDENIDGRV